MKYFVAYKLRFYKVYDGTIDVTWNTVVDVEEEIKDLSDIIKIEEQIEKTQGKRLKCNTDRPVIVNFIKL